MAKTRKASIRTARQLGRALGVSHTAANKWLKDERFPYSRRGPWSAATVAAIRAWADVTLKPAAPSDQPVARNGQLGLERRASVAVKVERAKTIRLSREILERKYHLVAECDALWAMRVHRTVTQMHAIAHSPEFPAEIRELLEKKLSATCNAWAESKGTLGILRVTLDTAQLQSGSDRLGGAIVEMRRKVERTIEDLRQQNVKTDRLHLIAVIERPGVDAIEEEALSPR